MIVGWGGAGSHGRLAPGRLPYCACCAPLCRPTFLEQNMYGSHPFVLGVEKGGLGGGVRWEHAL